MTKTYEELESENKGLLESETEEGAINEAKKIAAYVYKVVYLYTYNYAYWAAFYHPNRGRMRALIYPAGRVEYKKSRNDQRD